VRKIDIWLSFVLQQGTGNANTQALLMSCGSVKKSIKKDHPDLQTGRKQKRESGIVFHGYAWIFTHASNMMEGTASIEGRLSRISVANPVGMNYGHYENMLSL